MFMIIMTYGGVGCIELLITSDSMELGGQNTWFFWYVISAWAPVKKTNCCLLFFVCITLC